MGKIIKDDAGALRAQARRLAGDYGKFYTPECLAKLLVRLGGQKGDVLDPACGAGSLLIYAHEILGDDSYYYGQEISGESCALARKNLEANGVSKFWIEWCNTLEDDVDLDEGFDCVLANPPFSTKWNPDAVEDDVRFGGLYAPKSKADLAFVQHGLYLLKDGGTAAYILFPGALYRGGVEAKIRESFLPYVRAVVALPAKLFEETSIATALVVFEKVKSIDPIYFYDASEMFVEKGKKQNVISDEQIEDIVCAVKNREMIEGKDAEVEQKDILDNGCNLSPSAYIEKKVESTNPYDGRSIIEVIEDGEAWAEYSYRSSRQAYAQIRKSLGYEYNEEDVEFDVESIKPSTHDTFIQGKSPATRLLGE